MDFSCYILSQPWLTPFSHHEAKAEATTQVQQQIDSLCSRQQIQIQKPAAILSPAPSVWGWAEGDTEGRGGREVRGSQQTSVSNTEVIDSTVRGLLSGWGTGSGEGIIAFAEGGMPPFCIPCSRKRGRSRPPNRPQGDERPVWQLMRKVLGAGVAAQSGWSLPPPPVPDPAEVGGEHGKGGPGTAKVGTGEGWYRLEWGRGPGPPPLSVSSLGCGAKVQARCWGPGHGGPPTGGSHQAEPGH